MAEPERLIYLEDFTDEVMPCAPTLEAWAAWLAKPDPEYTRDAAAEDGETFKAYVDYVLGDVRVDRDGDGALTFTPPPPTGAEIFAKRHHEGGEGWDAEYMAETPEDALDCLDADDFPVWLACIKNGEQGLLVRFHADGPRCEVLFEAPDSIGGA
ncbi:hypothetical protein [Phenylobacterium sp.]|uniref:hypothetical protein n=1 Tax=Phenylobacterium sp. TaxID=1871053 RepID=UPI002737B3BD|nr:hypothetical protein [Phenylobacterium sp.]MDP3869140.1 hypothetical protein [Phenylobacterium sp.]